MHHFHRYHEPTPDETFAVLEHMTLLGAEITSSGSPTTAPRRFSETSFVLDGNHIQISKEGVHTPFVGIDARRWWIGYYDDDQQFVDGRNSLLFDAGLNIACVGADGIGLQRHWPTWDPEVRRTPRHLTALTKRLAEAAIFSADQLIAAVRFLHRPRS